MQHKMKVSDNAQEYYKNEAISKGFGTVLLGSLSVLFGAAAFIGFTKGLDVQVLNGSAALIGTVGCIKSLVNTVSNFKYANECRKKALDPCNKNKPAYETAKFSIS